MAYNVTTEWEDIHVKLGNYLPTQEKDATMAELEKIVVETAENYNPLAKKTMDELDSLEESDDEDEFLKEYKAKRMAELTELNKLPKYGSLTEIRKQDFIQQVNNAPYGVNVVICLYNDAIQKSLLMCQYFEFIAVKFPLVKFLKIEAHNCITNIRDCDIPSVIIYKNGALVHNFIPASAKFSENFTLKSDCLTRNRMDTEDVGHRRKQN